MIAVEEARQEDMRDLERIAGGGLDLDPADAAALPALLWPADPGTERVRLVARQDGRAIGLAIGSLQGEDAHLDLVVVAPEARRRGAGRALLERWESVATGAGARHLHAGGDLHAYAWPGVDVGYTPGLCLLLRAGYARSETVYDMDVPLDRPLAPSADRLAALEAAGVRVRRATPADRERLAAHVASLWTEVWTREVRIAVDRTEPTAFLAERDGRILGFAAHGGLRADRFGPVATDPAVQGLGIGDVLTRLCLQDMASRGVATAWIGWIAEEAIPFYSRTVGARIGRCYWILGREAGASS